MAIILPNFRLNEGEYNWTGRPLLGGKDKITSIASEGGLPIYTYTFPSDYNNRKDYPVLWHAGLLANHNPTIAFYREPRNFFARKGTLLRLPRSVMCSTEAGIFSSESEVAKAANSNPAYFDDKNIFVCEHFNLSHSVGEVLLSACFPPGIPLEFDEDGIPIDSGVDRYLYGECLIILSILGSDGSSVGKELFEAYANVRGEYINKFKRAKMIVYNYEGGKLPGKVYGYTTWEGVSGYLQGVLGDKFSYRSVAFGYVTQEVIMNDIRDFYGV